jgi:SNF2-related domain
MDLDKVQTFETMPWDEMKGWCDKWPKSNREMFIDTLSEDMNNDPNLIRIGEINLNRTWERRHFNASINPISTDKEPEDEHEDEIEEVDQEVDHLRDVREAHINPLLWVKALRFLSFPLTVRNTLRDATFHLYGMKKGKAMWTYQLLGVTHALSNCGVLGGTFLADTMGLGKTLQMLLIWYTSVLITKINLDWLDWKNQKGKDESLHLAPSTDEHPQPPNARCPSQIDGMPQCCCVEGSIARTFLNRPVGPTIYITRQNLLPQAVEDVESWFETSGLNDSIPGGRLQVRVRHTAFIRSSTKKYDFTDEDKDILEPIKCERDGKVWWKMDPRSASYLIITTSQTWATTWTAQEQHKTIFNIYRDDGPRCIVSGILADEFHTDRLETGYLMKIVKRVYNDQTVLPRFRHPGLSYKDGKGKIAYYTSRPSVVFTSGTPTSEGFTSLIPALEIFRAPNWKDIPATKLIHGRNIDALIKYEKLGVANRSSLPNNVITGFKECSSSIAKALIIRRMGEDRWFDGRVINELPLVVYQDCYVTNDPIFKPYIEKLWRGASLDAFEQLNKAFRHWEDNGRKGEEPVFNMDQFLEGAGRLLKIFAIFPGLAKVGDEWQDTWWKDKTKVGTKPRWTVDEFRNEKWDEPSDENPLWKNWSTIANSGKLKRIIKYVDEVLKRNPHERLLFSSYEPAACTLLRLVS